MAAYAGAVAWLGTSFLAMMGAGVIAFGVSYGGSQLLGLGQNVAAIDALATPETLLTNTPSNTAPIPVVYGQRQLGATVVFAEVNGAKNQFLDVVYAICEGEIEEIGTAYLDGEPVPELRQEAGPLFSLTMPGPGWVELTFNAAENSSVSGSFTGSWADLLTWAAGTYAGTLTATRGGFASQTPSGDYTLTVSPFNLAGYPGTDSPSLVLETEKAARSSIDITEHPTAGNAYQMTVTVEKRDPPIGIPSPGEASASATYSVYSEGDTTRAGLVEMYRHTGADDQTADPQLVTRSAKWTADHRLAGVAYVYARFIYNQSAFPRGVPTATWHIKGKLLLDPRDETTAWSDNPALAVLDLLTNSRYGRGIDLARVDLATFIAAANYCDLETEEDPPAKYWTCNGAVTTGQPVLENMKRLLTSCRGWLVFSGGLYKLTLDAPATSVFTFNEENITGAWAFSLGDKKTTANRVSAKFFDPAQGYKSDYAPADSPGLRALDRGLVLEHQIPLEFTNSKPEAYRHAVLALNQSRQGIGVQFAALPSGLVAQPGDVVAITHSRPGWAAKNFRVLNMRLRQAGDIEVTALEYSSSVYNWGEIPVFDPAPNTNLPSPRIVLPPGQPQVTEELYSTRAGAGVKAKAIVSWPESPDAYVDQYILQARGPYDVDWREAVKTKFLTAEILDSTPGRWSFRVQAVNSIGVYSPYSPITDYEIKGLLAPPATPTGFTLIAQSYLALLSWQPTPDLDVKTGGSFRVRHAPAAVPTPTWDDGQDIGEAVPGAANQVVLPLLAGTYFIKAVDSSGIESTAAASVYTSAPGLFSFSTLATWTAEPVWSGTHSGTEVFNATLRLEEGTGEVLELAGVWTGSNGLSLAAETPVRLEAVLEASPYAVQDTVDSRADFMDTWLDFDGAIAGAAKAEVWVSAYDAGASAWLPWERLIAADFVSQYFLFKVILQSTAPAFNIAVTGLTVTAKEVV
jgi:hypothetical protein